MTDFKILDEVTFTYKGGKLYLMFLKEGDTFCVEVIDRGKTYGRKSARSRAEASMLFDALSGKLSTFKCFDKAAKTLTKYFAFTNINKILFVILSDETKFGQKDVIALKEKLDFKMKVVIEDESVTIDVFLSGKKKFGTFTGTTNDNDLVFKVN